MSVPAEYTTLLSGATNLCEDAFMEQSSKVAEERVALCKLLTIFSALSRARSFLQSNSLRSSTRRPTLLE